MKNRKSIFLWLPALLLLCIVPAGCRRGAGASAGRSLLEARVDSVLARMSLEEKTGQMVQITMSAFTLPHSPQLDTAAVRRIFGQYRIGSVLNTFADTARTRDLTAENVRILQGIALEEIGIPILYGLDMIHGASYISDATLFPQEIAVAATFDRQFARKMGEATAYETRAAMVPWIFAPTMDLGRDPRWPRMWESWGEDAFLSSEMAVSAVRGLQGDDPDHIDSLHVGACVKHYLAYGVPTSGKDRTPARVPEPELREKYFQPFRASLCSGAVSLMANSGAVNGMPVHASRTWLTQWTKEELSWDGLIVTDWADLDNLWQRDHVAADEDEALCMGINAGVDLVMEPYDPAVAERIAALVRAGRIPAARVDDAVRRILRLKFRLGLFDTPTWDVSGYDRFGGMEFQQASLAAAVESAVLLKNERNLLPLDYGTRILVTGPNAHSMRALNGGWTYTWQGSGDLYAGDCNTIYEALAQTFGAENVRLERGVSYKEDGKWWEEDAAGISRAVAAAARCDVVVCCVGENAYCETNGNLDDLALSDGQRALVKALAATGKPVVLILNEGRPRLVSDVEPLCRAVVDIFLPGNYGGDALASLLSGEENFSGRLPFTYPRRSASLHTYDYKVSEHREMMAGEYNYDAVMDVQWPFGFGLSYTEFAYSDFRCLNGGAFAPADTLSFEVTVRNAGRHFGKEAVLLYSSDLVASLVPDVKRLRAFDKVALAPGEQTTVRFTLPATDLAFVGADGQWRLEEGDFRFSCGGLSLLATCSGTCESLFK